MPTPVPTPKNGTVWKLTTGALALFLVTTGAMWGMVSIHADSPHKNALARPEFDMFRDSVEGRLQRIESKVDALLSR